ncbi:MAG: NAD(P)H-hydrate dehydratase [Candidatus Acidiferrales bacterium]
MKVLTAAEMRDVDRLTAERYGVPTLTLMENAGTRVVEFLARRYPELAHRRILLLCGKGNNGGDGLVVARLLRDRGAKPLVVLFARPEEVRGDAAENLKRYQKHASELHSVPSLAQWEGFRSEIDSSAIIIDALLGTGLRGPVEGLLAQVIEDVNRRKSKAEVIAVDIPSGLSSDSGEVRGPAIRAGATVTFTALKIGQLLAPASEHVGLLRVVHIGSPWELIEQSSPSKVRWLEPREFVRLPTRRRPNTNKGNYGHALIVAGSRGKSGAAILAGWGALRSGAGLVTVATTETELPTVAGRIPELMTEPLPATEEGTIGLRAFEYGRFEEVRKGKTVLAIGPGLTTNVETQQFVRTVVLDALIPVVLDADGLNAFAGRGDEIKRHLAPRMVLTPHPGEMARLIGRTVPEVQQHRLDVAGRAAADWNVHLVLKGHQTVVAAPDGRTWVNSTGNAGMATAGTGDALTGMLAGIVAQFGEADWDSAVCLAVYLHGLAGDLAAADVGEAPLMASDLIAAIPRAYAHLQSEIDRVQD